MASEFPTISFNEETTKLLSRIIGDLCNLGFYPNNFPENKRFQSIIPVDDGEEQSEVMVPWSRNFGDDEMKIYFTRHDTDGNPEIYLDLGIRLLRHDFIRLNLTDINRRQDQYEIRDDVDYERFKRDKLTSIINLVKENQERLDALCS